MKITGIDKTNTESYNWGQNCLGWPLLNTPGLSVKLENMPSGTIEKQHFHMNAQQFFFILKGEAAFYIEGQKHILKNGQGFLVAPKAKHYIQNATNEVLEFLVISQPSAITDRIDL
ncbi:MAG: cupin domain-containing protein [Ferruginibacter sp.]